MCSDQRQSEHGFHDFASRWKRTVNCKQQTLFSLDIFMVRYVCRKKHTTKVYSTKSALIDKVECLCVCKDKLGSLPVSPLWIRADSGSHFMTNDPREPSVNWPVHDLLKGTDPGLKDYSPVTVTVCMYDSVTLSQYTLGRGKEVSMRFRLYTMPTACP